MGSTTFNKSSASTDLKAYFDKALNTLKVVVKLTTAGTLDVNTSFLDLKVFSSAGMRERKVDSVELEALIASEKVRNGNVAVSELPFNFTNLLPPGVFSDSLAITAFESNNAGNNAQIGPPNGLVVNILAAPGKPSLLLLSKTVTAGTAPWLNVAATVRLSLPLNDGGKPLSKYNIFVYGRTGSSASVLLRATSDTAISANDITAGFIDVPVGQTTVTGSATTPILDSDKIFIYASVDNTAALESPLSDPIEFVVSLKYTQPTIISVVNGAILDSGNPRIPLRVSADVTQNWDTLTIFQRSSVPIGQTNTATFTLAQSYAKSALAVDLTANGFVDLELSQTDTTPTTFKALAVHDIMVVVSTGTALLTNPLATQSNFTPIQRVVSGIVRTVHNILTQSGIITTGSLVEQRFNNSYTGTLFPPTHRGTGNDLYIKVVMKRRDKFGNSQSGPLDVYQQLVSNSAGNAPTSNTFNLRVGANPPTFNETDNFRFDNTLLISLTSLQLETLNLYPDLKARIETNQGANLFRYSEFSSLVDIKAQPTTTEGLPFVSIQNIEELTIGSPIQRRLGLSLFASQVYTDGSYPYFTVELQYSTNIGFTSGLQTVLIQGTDLAKEYFIINADTATSTTDFALSTTYYFRVRVLHAWMGASNSTLGSSALLYGQGGQTGTPSANLPGDWKTTSFTTSAAAAIPSPTVTMSRNRAQRLVVTVTQVSPTVTYNAQSDWKAVFVKYVVVNQINQAIPGLTRQVAYNEKIASGQALPPEIFDIRSEFLDQFLGAIVTIVYTRNNVTIESGSSRPPEIFYEKKPTIGLLTVNETSSQIQVIADVDVGVNDNNNGVVPGAAALVGGVGVARSLIVTALIPYIGSGNSATGTEGYSVNLAYDTATNTYRSSMLTKIANPALYGGNLRFTVFAYNNTGLDLKTYIVS